MSHHDISIRSHFNLHSALVFFPHRFFPCRLIPPFSYFLEASGARRSFIFRCKIGRARSALEEGKGNPSLACMQRGGMREQTVAVSMSTPRTTARAITTPAGRYPPVLGRGSWAVGFCFLFVCWGTHGVSGQFGDRRPGCQRAGLGSFEEQRRERPIRPHFSRGNNIHCRTELGADLENENILDVFLSLSR